MFRKIPIRHPDWLIYSNPQVAIRIFLRGNMPDNIAGWMIVTSLKHPLRCVYGSDLRAAWHLLIDALKEKFFSGLWYRWMEFRHPEWNEDERDDPT